MLKPPNQFFRVYRYLSLISGPQDLKKDLRFLVQATMTLHGYRGDPEVKREINRRLSGWKTPPCFFFL